MDWTTGKHTKGGFRENEIGLLIFSSQYTTHRSFQNPSLPPLRKGRTIRPLLRKEGRGLLTGVHGEVLDEFVVQGDDALII